MKWVTRKRIQVNRAVAAWLVRRFIDPQAELLFVEPDKVAGMQAREGAFGRSRAFGPRLFGRALS